MCAEVKEDAASYLAPLQIGVAQPLGTEIGYHTARQWHERHKSTPNAVFLKADFANAFNTVDRQAFLTQCREHFPGLSAWAEWCYAAPSKLFFGTHTISSESGVQQGDPLGPLLFSLALQPVLEQLRQTRSEGGLRLVFSYLDDVCLAGDASAVATAFATLKTSCEQIGLKLNTDKCELIPCAGLHSTVNRNLFLRDMVLRDDGNFELLGGPIGSANYCNQQTSRRVQKACELLKHLGELPDPQVALLLLRQCASFGKLVFSLRLVPHFEHADALEEFDAAVHECFESFMCANLASKDWTLATLSTKTCGLGLRSTSRHSVAAYLASRAACREFALKLDPDHATDFVTPDAPPAKVLAEYNRRVGPESRQVASTLCEKPPMQRDLSAHLDNQTLDCLKQDALNDGDQALLAHYSLTSAPNAGQWLHALPNPATRNKVDPLLFKTMIQQRLRAKIFDSEFACPLCDGVMDVFADHCRVCSGGGDRTKRHNHLRNHTFHWCQGAGLSPELEKPGLLLPRPMHGALHEDGTRQSDGRRPADVYVPRWRSGTPVAFDFAVTSGLRANSLVASLHDPRSAPTAYEDFKREHNSTELDCQAQGIQFIPIVAEAVGGAWGPAADKVFAQLAKLKTSMSGERSSQVLANLYQNLGIIIHRENARAVLRRSSAFDFNTSLHTLASAASLQSPP